MIKRIVLNKDARVLAEFFCDDRSDSVNASVYQKRGSFKRQDIVAGALGEMGVFRYLRSLGYKPHKPDLTIHKKRSYAPDIVSGKRRFHVKSQTTASAHKYGDSWLLQKNDPVVISPDAYDYYVLTNVDLDENAVEIKAIVKARDVLEHGAIGECARAWFRDSKVALYLKEIEEKLGKLNFLRRVK